MLETGHIQGLKSPLGVKGVIFFHLSLQLCNYIKFVPINRTLNRFLKKKGIEFEALHERSEVKAWNSTQ